MPLRERKIGQGDDAIFETLKVMKSYALTDSRIELVNNIAENIRKECSSITNINDKQFCYAEKAFNYIVKNVRYVEDKKAAEDVINTNQYDMNNVEFLVAPRKLLVRGYGDCDCMSTALCSILVNLKVPCRFVVIAWKSNSYSHVYPEVGLWLTQKGTYKPFWIPSDPVIKTFGIKKLPVKRHDEMRVL
jgi:hypothetical protein